MFQDFGKFLDSKFFSVSINDIGIYVLDEYQKKCIFLPAGTTVVCMYMYVCLYVLGPCLWVLWNCTWHLEQPQKRAGSVSVNVRNYWQIATLWNTNTFTEAWKNCCVNMNCIYGWPITIWVHLSLIFFSFWQDFLTYFFFHCLLLFEKGS